MTSPSAPKRASLQQEVRAATDGALALLRDAGIEESVAGGAEEVERVRRDRPERPTVVVVGETKRGKSSLVNALLNVPGLSPVDAQVATSTYLVFRRGERTAAHALVPGSDAPVPVPMDRLRDWATVLGSLPDDQPPPRMIEVECTSPLLANLVLIDTPGVGGLDSAHGEVAMAAVRRATAVLFVVDASAPFTGPELDFLRRAAESVDLVLFAVTKTDAYRGWRQVLDDDRALLKEHAPRFADAPMLPVSSRLFEQAAALPAGELAATLRTESQVIALQMLLQTKVAAKAAALHDANVLRAASTHLTALQLRLEAERAAIDPDPGHVERLRTDRDRLAQSRRHDGRTWQLRLRAEVARARIDSMHDAQREVRDQLQYWRASIDRGGGDLLKRLPQELDAVVHAMHLRVLERVTGRLYKVTDATLRELFGPEDLAQLYASFALHPLLGGPLSGPGKRGAAAEDRVTMVSGVIIGAGAGKMASLAGLAFLPLAAAAPLAVGMGVLASGLIVKLRRAHADKAHYKIWVADVLAESRADLENDIAGRFVDAEQSLTLALDQAIAQRVEQLDREIRQIDEALRMDAQEKGRRRKEVMSRLSQTTTSLERIDALLPRLRGAVVTSGLSPAALARLASGAVRPGTFPGGPGPTAPGGDAR